MKKMHFRFYRMGVICSFTLLAIASLPATSSGRDPKKIYKRDEKKITGKITDEKGAALAGVTVMVKGGKGVTTDENGAFTITVPSEKSVLIINYIGFASQEISASGTDFNIKMQPDTRKLEDVVVVGYGTQKKITVTGSVASVKGTELQKSPAVNLSNGLAGRMPGVVAMNSSGEPGYDGSTIRIRGSNTLGNNDALIVIDGVPARAGGLDRLNPADIESLSVLKDASAAIYGARAANGVILVTTKHGKTGKPELSYSFNQGWAQPTVVPKLANSTEYATMVNEIDLYNLPSQYWDAAAKSFKETGTFVNPSNGAITKSTFTPDDFKKFADGSDPWGHPNTDWFHDALQNWAPQNRQNLQISGGTENVKYLASLGYQNQDAYYKNSATGYKQYDMRLNLDAKVNKYINASLGIVARQENRFFPTKSAGSIFRMLMRGYPYKPAYWPNGLPGPDIENGEQPVVITTNQTGYDKDTRYYYQSNGRVVVNIPWVEGLKFTGNVSLDKYIQEGKTWQTPWYVYSWDYTTYEADGKTPQLQKVKRGPDKPTLNQYTQDQLNSMLEGILSYDHTFGNHTFNILAGVTKEQSNNNSFNGSRKYFISTLNDQLFAGSSAEKDANGSAWERARLNYFGRVGYNYKEKYIAEFLWRYDGSYMFPQDKRFGFFPGLMAGWRISEENFFKRGVPFINSLKLRGSWGQLGNDQVYFNNVLREYDYIATDVYDSYPIGGQIAQTLKENGVPNTNITWEVANNYDLGLEGSAINGRLSFEFDVFQNHRSNILWQRNASIPRSTGMTLPAENIGKVDNKGWEFKVGWVGNVGKDWRYNVSVNGGYAQNKIVFWDETPGAPDWQKSTGHPMNTSLYYKYDGIFSTQKDVDANTVDYSGVGASTLRPGDMRYVDYNHDGKLNGDDRVRDNRTTQPTFQGGLNFGVQYKNFDLAVLFVGAAGGAVFLQTESGTIGNFLQWSYDNRWTVDNLSTKAPRTVDRNNQYFSSGNDYWLFSTNYIRLRNVEIGYNLPQRLGKKVGINNLRLYANGFNLATFTKQKIFDPESVNSSLQYYPQSRIINVGATVTF